LGEEIPLIIFGIMGLWGNVVIAGFISLGWFYFQ
jgi:hypothetical protein